MRRLSLIAMLSWACAEDEKNYPMPVGTGGMGSLGTTQGHHSDSDSGDGSASSSTSDGGSSSAGGTDSGSSDSSGSSGGIACTQSGELCEDDGVCIATDGGWACGHREPGDPCQLPEDCTSLQCFIQPPELDAPGICTGFECERVGAPCDTDGICVTSPSGVRQCCHGEPGEPCLIDNDCQSQVCTDYRLDGGSLLVCM
jgi:hypothetical protein